MSHCSRIPLSEQRGAWEDSAAKQKAMGVRMCLGLFADRAAARKWATKHGLQGRVLMLTKAAGLATEEWKSRTNGGGGRP